MARNKKNHQRKPLIERIQARKIVEEHLKDDAVQYRVMTEARIMAYFGIVAVNEAFEAGELRLLRDYFPAFEKIAKQYEEWKKAAGAYYANQKLKEIVSKILPSQEFTIGMDELVLDDGEVL